MSHFYGVLKGMGSSEATRRGGKDSGMTSTVASWDGAIEVTLRHMKDGTDSFTVRMTPWKGKGDTKTLCSGIIGDKDSVCHPE